MCVSIREQGITIERRHPPIHRRIGRQAGLQGNYVRRRVVEAFLDRVIAGFRAQKSKPGRPNVRGDEMTALVHIEENLEQIAGGQAQDRPSVSADVADSLQPGLQSLDGGEVGCKNHVVDFARGALILVNRADFAGQHEPHLSLAGRRHCLLHRRGPLILEAKQPVLSRQQRVAHLLQPAGMRDVARADDVDAFALRPFGQILEGQVFASGA